MGTATRSSYSENEKALYVVNLENKLFQVLCEVLAH